MMILYESVLIDVTILYDLEPYDARTLRYNHGSRGGGGGGGGFSRVLSGGSAAAAAAAAADAGRGGSAVGVDRLQEPTTGVCAIVRVRVRVCERVRTRTHK
jgi:hypothetical protein